MVRGGADIDFDLMVGWSIKLAGAVAGLRYLTLVYHRARQDSDVMMKDQEKDFAAGYKGPGGGRSWRT